MALARFQRRPMRAAFPVFPASPMFEDLEKGMRKFLEDGTFSWDSDLMPQAIGWLPAMDISETPEAITLTAELPGLDLKDVDITVDDGVLSIRGEKADDRTVQNKKYHCVERSYGSFQRSFAIPRSVDAAKIDAQFGKGVLTVTMPKTGEAMAKGRKIDIAEQK